MMKITVERATAADIPHIAGLEKDTFSMPQSERELLKMLGSDNNILLVAKCDGSFAGYVGAYTVCRESDIVTIATNCDFRRKGVAKKMLIELFGELLGDSDVLFLEVRESNIAARSLYASLGFAEVGVRRGYYKNPTENAVLYKKEL